MSKARSISKISSNSVTSFNTRQGAVTLQSTDISTTLNFSPKAVTTITSLTYSGDDLAVSTTSPLPITINGTDFESNSTVYVDTILPTNAATAISYTGTTQITCTPPAKSAASYNLWIVGPTGKLTVLANGILYSGTPNWSGQNTSLSAYASSVNIQLSAAGDTPLVYSLVSGTLPTGVTLNSSGLISGTATGLTQATTFSNLVIRASDPQNQDASITINLTVQAAQQISRSLRFNSADSAYLSRTPASAGNQKTYTVSVWLKRSAIGASGFSFLSVGASTGGPRADWAIFQDYLAIGFNPSGGTWLEVDTSALYRDVSAWYHVVVAVDTTQATSTDRVKLYVNGSLVTAFLSASYPSQNSDTLFNGTGVHAIGRYNAGSSNYYSGYMAEHYMIDGQALTPSSFGQINSNTGVWEPKPYTGTYGTNGYYLNFSDNSGTTSTTLGKDYSGNGNNWTPNNFSVTAGAGNDSLVDTPTPYGTDTGAGGEVRGNYATLNPLDAGSNLTFAEGNLQVSSTTNPNNNCRGTLGVATGKWYWEVTVTAGTGGAALGIASASASMTTNFSGDLYGYDSNGNKQIGATGSAYGATYGTNDVIGIAFDADNLTITFYKNNTSQGAITGVTSGLTWRPFVHVNSRTVVANFGQRPFAYTAPSGFKALCTQNLPTPAVVQGDDYFNTVLWTGTSTSSARSITGVGFQPDFVWEKPRSAGYTHSLFDAVRGVNKQLSSNQTSAEETNFQYGYLSSFDADGFTATPGSTDNENWNETGTTYVAWNWKANGAGSSNTAGTITSTVSANTTSGFSIVTATKSGGTSVAQTFGHGLGVVPSMIILKRRDSAEAWYVYHQTLGNNSRIQLNETTAATSPTGVWDATSPTSSVFTVRSFVDGAFVAYCFAAIPGYSAFGSYTGNGSTDGPFVYLGFRPKFIMFKRTDSANVWSILDTSRDPYNVANLSLQPSNSIAEETGKNVDFLSNGFKQRQADPGWNASGGTYIYAAFAENPFKYALAR